MQSRRRHGDGKAWLNGQALVNDASDSAETRVLTSIAVLDFR
jgi:hypothetical protein